jgi:hypothetical protein
MGDDPILKILEGIFPEPLRAGNRIRGKIVDEQVTKPESLPPSERVALILKNWKGLTQRERLTVICAALGEMDPAYNPLKERQTEFTSLEIIAEVERLQK